MILYRFESCLKPTSFDVFETHLKVLIFYVNFVVATKK